MDWDGKPRKLMLWANRNGFTYVLDRTTGEFLRGQPFVKENWASGLDKQGHPIRIPGMEPTPQGTLIYPGMQGGTNWYSPSYSPRTGLFYIPSWENYKTVFRKVPGPDSDGRPTYSVQPRSAIPGVNRPQTISWTEEDGYGVVRAIDPRTGEKKWDFKMSDVTDSGILTTATDVLFTGGREGYFYALDATSGALLWKATVGGAIFAGPITYSVAGKQYVAVASGNSLFAFALKQ
jgi:alcohol dehydrogenase (cytochrome c)